MKLKLQAIQFIKLLPNQYVCIKIDTQRIELSPSSS